MDYILYLWTMLLATVLYSATSSRTPRTTACDRKDSLNLEYKSFTTLEETGCDVTQLQIIHLTYNNITHLKAEVFNSATSLIHLLIVGNFMETLDPLLFSNLKELRSLDLSHNKIKSLTDPRIFSSQSKLQILRLHHNKIKTFDLKVLVPLTSLETLQLHHNPFYCDCGLYLTIKWCVEKKFSQNVTCNNGTLWDDLNSFDYCEVSENSRTELQIYLIIIAVVVLCVCILILVIYCVRKTRQTRVRKIDANCEDISASQDFKYNDLLSDVETTRYRTMSPMEILVNSSAEQCQYNVPQKYAKVVKKQKSGTCDRGTIESCHQDTDLVKDELLTSDAITYAEPFQQKTEISETYAVPYQYSSISNTVCGERNDELSVENVLYSKPDITINHNEISVRNSLYAETERISPKT